MAAEKEQELPNLVVKWSGKEYLIDSITNSDTVEQLKAIIAKKTNVLPERQKLLGLKYKGIVHFSPIDRSDDAYETYLQLSK